ncbi:MAG: hypothetical protein ACHQAY_03475 [Hyphomicrobiales bacterium]
MSASRAGLTIANLMFTGAPEEKAGLVLQPGLNVLYGASNTGKSFTVRTIDFMLGSTRPLRDIRERNGFERAWMAVTLPKAGDVTLMRPLVGGSFELYPGHVCTPEAASENIRQLSAKHHHANTDNISQFLLDELGFEGKWVATDVYGKKRSLSFRDLARFCIVDETAIQGEASPAESGQYLSPTVERSVFKLLITGQDDSAIIPVVDRKTFKTSTAAKLEVVDELITAVSDELTADFPNADQLPDQSGLLEESWARAQRDVQMAQESIRARLSAKRQLASDISNRERRRAEIQINLGRFEQLEEVYRSDIERLQAIEEAGFLLALGGDKDCPLCGAPPEAQRHVHGLADIEKARDAAGAEIDKIKQQRTDLRATIEQLSTEGQEIERTLERLDDQLTNLESELASLAPAADVAKKHVDELLSVRDEVRRGLTLLDQRQSLTMRREELSALKPASKAERPRLGASGPTVHDFAQTVSKVLEEWQFPGNRHVSFDEGTYDLRIDGKSRRDNGKGVRAITHAAFKVALVMFCRERGLPHPGFLVLDTPMLTYRDPLRSKEGPLDPDEQAIRNTSLKEFFFEHLSKLAGLGQFIVVENVDLPDGIERLAHMEVFTGDSTTGRVGLFPTSVHPS